MIALNERRARRARQEGRHSGDRVRLRIPDAYVLDDLTLGVLWAVSSLDSALLYDDALIAELREELDAFATFRRSSAGRDMVAELTAVSQLWVGSDFCARYVLQQSGRLTSAPDFWTRERTGEEASTWLLFAHKHDYLQALSNRFPSSTTRSFCLPEAAVSKAPRAERILFLLTAALMESFGIRVQVSDEPAYGAVEGFVLNPGEQAIVANWLGSDGVWHVDMTDSTPTLREYMDVTGYAHAHSVISADTSRGRLCSLAEYLDVNWAWLVSRCAQIGAYGFVGLAPPSSRLLSTAGVDRACRFIGRTGSSGR